tara:strand:- start:5081 stop:5293 length:213 start_codon:yes stop_codon:yes gene_type:complete
MTDKCQTTWEPTEEQIDNIIIPAMKGIAQQCASYINELHCPPECVAVMLRDIADAFEMETAKDKNDCSCF